MTEVIAHLMVFHNEKIRHRSQLHSKFPIGHAKAQRVMQNAVNDMSIKHDLARSLMPQLRNHDVRKDLTSVTVDLLKGLNNAQFNKHLKGLRRFWKTDIQKRH